MYSSPPSLSHTTFLQLLAAFLRRTIVGGLKYGAGAGAAYGALLGTVLAPGTGTILGLILGLVIGLIAGLVLGLGNGIVLSIISHVWLNPVEDIEVYRRRLGGASVFLTFGSVVVVPPAIGFIRSNRFNAEGIVSTAVLFIVPGAIAAYYFWRISQQLADWYELERAYTSGETLPPHDPADPSSMLSSPESSDL